MSITFPYNPNIPNAPDNPSFDQPIMKSNSSSINLIWGVDHVRFDGTAGTGGPGSSAGQHLQVTFNGKNAPGSPPTDPISVVYSNTVMMGAFNTQSASPVAEVFFQNSNAIMPVSMIKAFGNFDSNATSLNTWNCKAALSGGAGTFVYTISMPPNLVTTTNYSVFVNIDSGPTTPYTISTARSTATQFTIKFLSPIGTGSSSQAAFSVMVMQL